MYSTVAIVTFEEVIAVRQKRRHEMRGLLVNGLAGLSGVLTFAGAPAIGCDWGCWGGCSAYYAAPAYGYSEPAYGYSTPAYGYSAPAYGYAAPPYAYAAPVNAYTAPPGYGYYVAPPAYYAPQPAYAAYGPPAVSYPPNVYFAPTITNGPYFGNSARLAPSSPPAYAKRTAIARSGAGNGRQKVLLAANPTDRGVKIKSTAVVIKSTAMVNGPRNKGPNVRSDIRASAPPLPMNGRLANNSFPVSRNVGLLPRRQLP